MGNQKLDIKFSRRTKKLARFDTTFSNLVFAQLVALGYGANEAAWVAYFGFNKLATNERLDAKARDCMTNDKIKEVIKYFKDELSSQTGNTSASESLDNLISQRISESGEMDKDATAMEMLRIAQTLPDGKERADLLLKYADIKGFKKVDDRQTQVRHTMIYIPATCDKCPVLNYVKETNPDVLKSKKPKSEV